MKIFLLTLLFSSILCHAFCQIINDISGRPYRNTFDNELLGSPFLFENWRVAKIKLKTLGEFDNVKVKFNPFNNLFYYNKNDSLYEFIDELEEVRIKNNDHLNESGYDIVFTKDIYTNDKVSTGAFVQILCKGKITIIKYFKGKIDENNESSTFGSQGKTKKLITTSTVLAITNNQTQSIQYNLKKLQLLTIDKTSEINNFIKLKGLNIKKEVDFVVAVAYYNFISM